MLALGYVNLREWEIIKAVELLESKGFSTTGALIRPVVPNASGESIPYEFSLSSNGKFNFLKINGEYWGRGLFPVVGDVLRCKEQWRPYVVTRGEQVIEYRYPRYRIGKERTSTEWVGKVGLSPVPKWQTQSSVWRASSSMNPSFCRITIKVSELTVMRAREFSNHLFNLSGISENHLHSMIPGKFFDASWMCVVMLYEIQGRKPEGKRYYRKLRIK